MSNPYQTIVLGLGGMGSAAAYHLSARKQKILGLESRTPAHDQGSSHGDSRIIRQSYHEHPNYVPLAQRAYELWRRLEHDAGAHLLKQTGGLILGPPGSSLVQGALHSATQHNLPHQILDAKEIRTRYPVLNPRSDETALYDELAGYLHPEVAIQAHLHLASKYGADLHFEESALGWKATSSGIEVLTSKATYHADHLILAPGAWAPDILSGIGIDLQIHRHVMCWFQPVSHPASFHPDQFPVYIWDVDGRHCFYGFPNTGSLPNGIKAALHSGGHPCTAHDVDREIQPSDIAEVRDYLERFIPSLNGLLTKAVTCLYTMTPDEHFLVGPHPSHGNVSIAAGFSGHGFKFSSVMGEILADLAISGQTSQPIDFLSPKRFNLNRQ